MLERRMMLSHFQSALVSGGGSVETQDGKQADINILLHRLIIILHPHTFCTFAYLHQHYYYVRHSACYTSINI